VLAPTAGSAWNSGIGTLVSWEPFDFGLRRATVEAAQAARAQTQAALRRTQLEVMVAVADACLTLEAAEQTVRAAQAGVDRATDVGKEIDALVKAELRPGADASRAAAELAAARSQWIQAQAAADIARATLSQYLGTPPEQIAIAAPKTLEMPPERALAPLDPAGNPMTAEQKAAINQAQAQLRAAEHAFAPRFQLQGSAYGRGSGADVSGIFLGGVNGLAPNIGNYAVGLTVSIPLGDWAAVQAREAANAANVRAQQARAQQIAVELHAQWNKAIATLRGARRVAGNTPYAVTAARAAASQTQARYQAGLGTIAELADAHRLLTQSEIDDALARLSVWRAMLAVAAVTGDLQPFLAELQ
jgi:outer membrane protein TolC